MNNRYLIGLIVLCIGIASANPGFVLSIRPGKMVEGFGLGCKFGGFVPEFGVDFGSGSFTTKSATQTPDTTYSSEFKASATVIVPHLGFKYLFGTKDLHPYLGMSFLYTFGIASGEIDGVEDEQTSELLEDALSGNLGIGFCFGGEYFFSEQFSFSGDVGFTYYMGSTKTEYEYTPGYLDILENSLGLGLTNVNWGLNFYF